MSTPSSEAKVALIRDAYLKLIEAIDSKDTKKVNEVLDSTRDNDIGKPWEIMNYIGIQELSNDIREPTKKLDDETRKSFFEKYNPLMAISNQAKTYSREFYSGLNPLFRAIMKQDIVTIKVLLDRGADPNLIRCDDLFVALLKGGESYPQISSNNTKEILKLLILNGYDPENRMEPKNNLERGIEKEISFSSVLRKFCEPDPMIEHDKGVLKTISNGELKLNDKAKNEVSLRLNAKIKLLNADQEVYNIGIRDLQKIIAETPTQKQVQKKGAELLTSYLSKGPGALLKEGTEQHPNFMQEVTNKSKKPKGGDD